MARTPLPDPSDAAAFSRETALLEAVAGNQATPVEDREFLAETMPFPNILVKLSEDPNPSVRAKVAANANDKNWLVGRLTKDSDQGVRTAALLNPRTSWAMRLEGAQREDTSVEALQFLATLGLATEPDAPKVLASMVRRAVAVNPTTPMETVRSLSEDASEEVRHAAQARLQESAD